MNVSQALKAQGFQHTPGTPPAFDNYTRPDGLFAQVKHEPGMVYVYNKQKRLLFIMSATMIEQASIDVFGLELKDRLAAE